MQPDDYVSFVIRLWRTSPNEETACGWRSEIEHIQSGVRHTFGSVNELLAFIDQAAESPQLLSLSLPDEQ